MKAKNRLLVTSMIVCLALFSFPIICAGEDFPNFPWQTWGSITEFVDRSDEVGIDYDDEFKFTGHIEQGVDWFRFGKNGPIFDTFVGMNGVWTDIEEHWWDRYYSPEVGAKLKFPFSFGEVSVGVRWEYFKYYGDEKPYDDEWRTGLFLQWYAGGNWRK